MRHPAVLATCLAAALTVVLGACDGGSAAAPPTPAPTASTSGTGRPAGPAAWTSYHDNQARTGAVAAVPTLDHLEQAWSADLGAAVRGQALVVDGQVIAATENNRVTALDPSSGAVRWSYSLGPPLTGVRGVVGCGNVDPLGVTSTPVVDPKTGTVWVVGEVSDGGGQVHHQLVGLAVTTGAVRASAAVDPPLPAGENRRYLLQRASLALAGARVYVSYGGHYGDCGSYHGWVVGAEESRPSVQVWFEAAADGEGGAIWQSGGAPAVDAAGDLYVTTGNANPAPPAGGPDPKAYTESVVKLSPDLRPLASYKDQVAGGDEDLSTGNPVLLPDGTVFAVGKTDIAFLLSAGDLHEVGRVAGVCGSDPDGGPAYDRATDRMFVPCRDVGIQVVDLRTRTLGPRLSGADSAPIVVGSTVWALDANRDALTAFDAASGRTLQTVDVGTDVPVFSSPSVGIGLLLVPTTRGVTAFR